jgi:hypothetical protein
MEKIRIRDKHPGSTTLLVSVQAIDQIIEISYVVDERAYIYCP